MTRPTAAATSLLLAVFGLGLGGCAGLLAPAPEAPHAYGLDPRVGPGREGFADTGTRRAARSIYVAPVHAVAPFDSVKMAYIPRLHEVAYFASSEWAAEPARLLTTAVVAGLEASGRFGLVTTSARAGPVDVALDLELVELVHDFTLEPSTARVILRAALTDVAEQRVVASRRFTRTAPAPSGDPYGGVQALNGILERLVPDIVSFSASTPASRPGT